MRIKTIQVVFNDASVDFNIVADFLTTKKQVTLIRLSSSREERVINFHRVSRIIDPVVDKLSELAIEIQTKLSLRSRCS